MRPKILDEFVGQEHLFFSFSAVISKIDDVRRVVSKAKELKKLYGKTTIIFIDEIHRFNKAQQDSFLPYVEDRTIILIGATTENPGLEVIAPLISLLPNLPLLFIKRKRNRDHC